MSPGQDSTLGDIDSSDDGSRRRRSGSMGRRRTDSGDGGSSAVGRRRRSSVNFDASQIDVALEYVTHLVVPTAGCWPATSQSKQLAVPQCHFDMDGRTLLLAMTLECCPPLSH